MGTSRRSENLNLSLPNTFSLCGGMGGQLGQSGFGDYLPRLPEGKPCTLVGIRQSWLLVDDLMNMGAGEGAEPLLPIFTMYKYKWPLGLQRKALCCHVVTEWGRTQHFNLLPKVSDLGVRDSSVKYNEVSRSCLEC